jgi:hypothetical protein
MRAFYGRVTAMFYNTLQGINCIYQDDVDRKIRSLKRDDFHQKIEQIRLDIFAAAEQSPNETVPVDYEFSAHAKFLQQMETYKTLKYAIKYADVGLIKRALARCCLLFHGSNKSKYAFLSLYMFWLTQTDAASEELQAAILANSLVNLRGATDSWFEMDRLNEFFNLHMKTLMVARKTSTINVVELFRKAALTASYNTDLKEAIEAAFGEHTNNRHQVKDATVEVRNLACTIAVSGSVTKHLDGRSSKFQPADILGQGFKLLNNGVKKFNQRVVEGQWEDEDDLSQATATHITAIEDIVTIDDDVDD